MLPMDMPQQQHRLANGFAPPLSRQLSYSAFSVDSPDSGGLADGCNHHAGQHPLTPGAMSGFGGQDASGWFVPLTMNGPDANQSMGMGGNAVDPFINMFGITPNQLDALQYTL
ncbi:hypothetical protein HRG_009548 [Hirsutella rhossiliensis]|uniref:Uncharacterized protein n=1 Tax=Hirsutella rhossiliensis TaxID=111463 RepID=A0A9P8MPK1_9HYPO|nr:uncharacterized protein HRG_09548 [Hirsutella rhossiliensis]KAH0959087.1 hypothetical protein HRG_09548 [Hirsutella rhossiliensis]